MKILLITEPPVGQKYADTIRKSVEADIVIHKAALGDFKVIKTIYAEVELEVV